MGSGGGEAIVQEGFARAWARWRIGWGDGQGAGVVVVVVKQVCNVSTRLAVVRGNNSSQLLSSQPATYSPRRSRQCVRRSGAFCSTFSSELHAESATGGIFQVTRLSHHFVGKLSSLELSTASGHRTVTAPLPSGLCSCQRKWRTPTIALPRQHSGSRPCSQVNLSIQCCVAIGGAGCCAR